MRFLLGVLLAKMGLATVAQGQAKLIAACPTLAAQCSAEPNSTPDMNCMLQTDPASMAPGACQDALNAQLAATANHASVNRTNHWGMRKEPRGKGPLEEVKTIITKVTTQIEKTFGGKGKWKNSTNVTHSERPPVFKKLWEKIKERTNGKNASRTIERWGGKNSTERPWGKGENATRRQASWGNEIPKGVHSRGEENGREDNGPHDSRENHWPHGEMNHSWPHREMNHSWPHGEMNHSWPHGEMNHSWPRRENHSWPHGEMNHSWPHGEMNHSWPHGEMNHSRWPRMNETQERHEKNETRRPPMHGKGEEEHGDEGARGQPFMGPPIMGGKGFNGNQGGSHGKGFNGNQGSDGKNSNNATRTTPQHNMPPAGASPKGPRHGPN